MKNDSFKIINNNLKEAEWYSGYAEKIRTGELHELLHMLNSNSEFTPDTIVSYFKSAFDESLCSPAYAAFCALAANCSDNKLCSEIFSSQDGWSFEYNTKGYVKAAVFPNKFSAAVISKLYPDAEVSYTHDYISSCEEVFYSRADITILPFASSSEGQFVSFFKLASKYDLYMTKRICISVPDSDDIMDFALYERHITPCHSHCFLHVLLPCIMYNTLTDFMVSIKSAGGSIVSLNYLNETHMQLKTTVLLEIADSALPSVVLFLKTVFPSFVPLGLFEHVPEVIKVN